MDSSVPARLYALNRARLCDVDKVESLATRAALECFSVPTDVGFASRALYEKCETCKEIGSKRPSREGALPSVSSWFGDARLAVDLAVEGACTDWVKPVDRPHHHTCWSVSDLNTDTNHASTDRSNQAAPPNDARLLLASQSTFLKMRAIQAVSAGARSIMGFLPLRDKPSNYTYQNRPQSISLCRASGRSWMEILLVCLMS